MLKEIKGEFAAIASPESLAFTVRAILAEEHSFDQQKEHFFGVGLTSKNHIAYIDLVTLGVLDASLVHPRESFRHAVVQGVSSIAFIHNHPSGDVTPSKEDRAVTERLVAAGKILGINVLDHLIIGNGTEKFYSMREDSSFTWD